MTEHIQRLLNILENASTKGRAMISIDITANGTTYYVHLNKEVEVFDDWLALNSYIMQFDTLTADKLLKKGGLECEEE